MPYRRATRNAPPIVTAILVILAIALIVVGIMYFTQTAAHLPSFFPGHKSGSKGGKQHHTKHGILAVVLGVVALAGAWLSAGRKRY